MGIIYSTACSLSLVIAERTVYYGGITIRIIHSATIHCHVTAEIAFGQIEGYEIIDIRDVV